MACGSHGFSVLFAAFILAAAPFTAACTRAVCVLDVSLGVYMRSILSGAASDRDEDAAPFTFQPAD